ncbi:MAG: glycosyltransferase [Gammaproteobacteria bacterium]|jgi:glycosyltransferase involved in cell wall biosynthesis|nr:glycosyltransferase [Gammaproteobacteria bacterium]
MSPGTQAPLNVALVTTSFPLLPSSVSGIFVARLVDHLPEPIRATVITPCATRPTAPTLRGRHRLACFRYAPWSWQVLAHRPGGLPAALDGGGIVPFLLPALFGAMLGKCVAAARHADVLHANWSVPGVVAGLAGLFARKPVVTTLRGSDVTRAVSSRVHSAALRLALRLSDRVLTVSRAMQERLCDWWPEEAAKVEFLANGVEPELLSIEARASNYRGAPMQALSLGNLVPNKGVHVVIEALSRIPAGERPTLTVAGDGPERHRLQAQVDGAGLGPWVRFSGAVPPSAVPDLLAAHDVLVLASRAEGRPNVVIEALAAGLAVLASDIEGVREVVVDGRNGLTFQSADAGGLAEGLARLARQPELRQALAEQGRRYVIDEGLLWPRTAARYAEVYEEVSGRARRG